MKNDTAPREQEKQPSCFGVGPFTVDTNKQQVTLAPGCYRLTRPIVFGIVAETEITGVETGPLKCGSSRSAR